MRIRIAALWAAQFVFLACCYAADDVPQWLKEAAGSAVPAYPPKVTAVVLLNDESTSVTDSGKLLTTTRTAIKFIARQGGAGVSFYDQYDKASGKVRDFRAWMIPPSGKVKKYGKDEILDVACAENDVYNECRRRMVSGKADAQAGGVFAYESVVERQVFVPQLSFHFQQTMPVRVARFAVTVPSGWEVTSHSFNGAPRESVTAGSTYRWEMSDLAAIEPEPSAPSVYTLAPWVGVSLSGGPRSITSWSAAAKLLAELNSGTAEATEAVASKARALVEGATSELDKIRAIAQFVQQINYVSIQVNVGKGGGYRPHSSTEVFEKRYGDCKDKANLMRAMLSAVGLTALPVAIYSGDRTAVVREWPSLGVFNHAISAIRVSAETDAPAVLNHPKLGRLLFFDPTDPHVPAGFLPSDEQGSLALVGDPEAGDLVQVPTTAARSSERRRTVEAVLSGEGGLTGTFIDRRSGMELATARSIYRSMPKPDYTALTERWISRGAPGATVNGIEVRDLPHEFTLEARLATPRYAQSPQQRMLIFRAAPLVHAGGQSFTGKARAHPIVMDADSLEETVRIAAPDGFRVDEIPDAISLNSQFGRYRAKWTSEGQTIVFEQKLEIDAQTVPAERYGELKKFLDVVYGAAGRQVVLLR